MQASTHAWMQTGFFFSSCQMSCIRTERAALLHGIRTNVASRCPTATRRTVGTVTHSNPHTSVTLQREGHHVNLHRCTRNYLLLTAAESSSTMSTYVITCLQKHICKYVHRKMHAHNYSPRISEPYTPDQCRIVQHPLLDALVAAESTAQKKIMAIGGCAALVFHP